MDLDQSEVVQREATAGEHAASGRYGAQQQVIPAGVVYCGNFCVYDLGEDGQVMLLRPLLAREQCRSGAIRQSSGVAGSHGAVGSTEDGTELRELLDRGVGAQNRVAGDAQVRSDEV